MTPSTKATPSQDVGAHTPGPWHLDGAVIRGTRADGKERPIAEIYRRVGGVDHEAIANANLILAAPDLLRALQRLSACLSFNDEWSPCGCFPEPDRLMDVMQDAAAALSKSDPSL